MDGERARTLLKFELKLSGGLGEEEDGQQHFKGDLQSRLVDPTGTKGHFLVPGHATSRDKSFTPGWSHHPGVKVDLWSQLVAPTGTKGPLPQWPGAGAVGQGPLVPVGATNRD